MNIYTSLHIGEYHTNHCEDFLICEQVGTHEKLIAVMDGCTMGKESVFASHLYGKLLRHIAKKQYYQSFISNNHTSLKETLKQVLTNLFSETKEVKRLLDLETAELLSTLIIGIVNTESLKAEFLTVGDGLIYIDGTIHEYEQNDKPDYLGYHLNKDFETWFQDQNQFLSISSFKDLSISTDGIFTFKRFHSKIEQKSEQEIIEYLLKDNTYQSHTNLLDRKINDLKQDEHHVVTDDLAIIRLIS